MSAIGLERLQFMVGEWNIKAYNMGETGEWEDSPLPKHTEIETLFDGKFLQEREVKMQVGEQRISFFIMWSYDKFRKIYKMLACDNHDGLADILEGNFEGETITVSNLKTGTAMLDEQGQSIYLRLSSTKNHEDSFISSFYNFRRHINYGDMY